MRGTALAGISIVGMLLGAVAARANVPESGSASTPRERSEGVIDPRADLALKRMCNYMASLKSLRVDTTTVDEKVTATGRKIQELKESRVEMQRPNQIAVDRTGPSGRVLFRYDGKHFVIFSADRNVYASTAAPPTLQAAIDQARDRLGIDAPGGDLIVPDAYTALLDGVIEGRYIGLEPVGGVMTHHLAMRKDKTDYQLWIKDGPEPVPVRYVITSRDMPGAPQFTLELRNFTPNVPLSDSSFAFIPPPGVRQVAFGSKSGSNL